ncbi:unnamed protein product [Rotaria socialis]
MESKQSSFSYLFKEFKYCQYIPTKSVAVYEQYLKQFCTTNTKGSVDCLYDTGNTYEKISDKENALEFYEKVLALDDFNKFQKNGEVQKWIEKLKKPSKTYSTVNDKRISRTFQNSIGNTAVKPSIKIHLDQL